MFSVAIHCLLRYVLIDDKSSFTRIMMHELYDSDQNIDIAFVGSSHVYRTFVPKVTDDGFGCYTFNAGSSLQYMDGSYAVVRELCKNHDVKTIFLELYYGVVETNNYSEREDLTSTYLISDYMRPSLDKWIYLLNASSRKYYVNSFLVERRNWEKLFDRDFMLNTIQKKQSLKYRKFVYEENDDYPDYYVERGFGSNDSVLCDNDRISQGTPIDIVNMNYSSDWYKSLSDIVSYCKKNNIELVFFITPMPTYSVVSLGNYQDYHNYIDSIAKEKDVDFYDFNCCKSKYFDCNDNEMFSDSNHLSTKGAYIFSQLFADFFTNKISIEELFYKSYEEKMISEAANVYGIVKNSDLCTIIANKKENIIFDVTVYNDKGEKQRIMDDEVESTFKLPYNEGIVEIKWNTNSGIANELVVNY